MKMFSLVEVENHVDDSSGAVASEADHQWGNGEILDLSPADRATIEASGVLVQGDYVMVSSKVDTPPLKWWQR